MNMQQLENRLAQIEQKQREIEARQDDIDRKLIGDGVIELGGNRLKIDISGSISQLKSSS